MQGAGEGPFQVVGTVHICTGIEEGIRLAQSRAGGSWGVRREREEVMLEQGQGLGESEGPGSQGSAVSWEFPGPAST